MQVNFEVRIVFLYKNQPKNDCIMKILQIFPTVITIVKILHTNI